MNWFYIRFSAFSDSISRFFRQPITSLLHILGMGIALSIPMGCYMLLDGADQFSRKLNNSTQLNVFLTTEASDETVKTAQTQLEELFDGDIKFIDRDQGLSELSKNPEFSELVANLDTNPIPHLFVLTPNQNDPQRLLSIAQVIENWTFVEEVRFDADWAGKLESFVKLSKILVMLVVLLIGLGFVASIFTTIQLQITIRKDEIEVARLVGATGRFIRRPFLYYGFIQGLLGGLCAVFIIFLGMKYGLKSVQPMLEPLGIFIRKPSLLTLAAPLILSVSLSLLGAWLSSNNHLRKIDS
ncbi:MAG: permease-like cell division protein FtsX [Proteobacteria bacterium]|nr:permease-like cell division protein FtsX [Pseudomonadota bacterium]MDA1011914.1 permease-like cell division protein FtsX [Pseudomonadota bacterium]